MAISEVINATGYTLNKVIPWYADKEWLMVVATLLLGIFAIFQEYFKKIFLRTKLEINLSLEPPDCHFIQLRNDEGVVSPSYYVRTRIINQGSNVAKNVQVMIDNMYQVKETGEKQKLSTFLPINLKWSHYGVIELSSLLPKFYRHCDIGKFVNVSNRAYFIFDTAVQPNPVQGGKIPNLLEPGKYEFDLILGGENTPRHSKHFELWFDGSFAVTEEIMFGQHVTLKESSN
jgi:hypothetical protein